MNPITIKPDAQGKVRDIYDLGDTLLFVATDRIRRLTTFWKTKFPIRAPGFLPRSAASGSNCSGRCRKPPGLF